MFFEYRFSLLPRDTHRFNDELFLSQSHFSDRLRKRYTLQELAMMSLAILTICQHYWAQHSLFPQELWTHSELTYIPNNHSLQQKSREHYPYSCTCNACWFVCKYIATHYWNLENQEAFDKVKQKLRYWLDEKWWLTVITTVISKCSKFHTKSEEHSQGHEILTKKNMEYHIEGSLFSILYQDSSFREEDLPSVTYCKTPLDNP